jgi:DNA polymerase-3 subunit alpha
MYTSHSTVEAAALAGRTEVCVGGVLSAMKFSHTKTARPGSNQTRYAMFDLEDMQGILRSIIWPEEFAQYGHLVQAEAVLFIRGTIEKRPGSDEPTLIVNEIVPLDQLGQRYTKGVVVRIDEAAHGPERLDQLREILRGYPGPCDVELAISLTDGTRVRCRAGSLRVAPDAEMRARIEQLLGPGHLRLVAAPPAPASSGRGNGYGRNGGRR